MGRDAEDQLFEESSQGGGTFMGGIVSMTPAQAK